MAEKYNALTFIDECHGTGVIGETGRYFSLYKYFRTILSISTTKARDAKNIEFVTTNIKACCEPHYLF